MAVEYSRHSDSGDVSSYYPNYCKPITVSDILMKTLLDAMYTAASLSLSIYIYLSLSLSLTVAESLAIIQATYDCN